MQTRQTSRFTRRHQLVVLATLAVVVLVTLVATLLARPPYASTAEALVGGQGQSAGDSSRARAASYAERAESRPHATAVDRTLGTTLSAAELQDRISAVVVPGTLLLRIRATDSDPATAQKICAAVLQQLRTLVADVDPSARAGVDSIGTVSAASLPTDRAAGHLGRNLGLSVPIGLILGLLLAGGLAFRRRPVRSRADVEAVVDAPLLGTVPVNGQVAALIGPDARGTDDLIRLREGFRFLGVDAASSVIVLVSPHRGHDAVESATHLAVSMAGAGEDVLLVDADLRLPEVADLLRLDGTVGLSSVLIGEHDLADAVQTHASSGLAVLTSGAVPPNAAELTGSLAMRDAFARARSTYATVLVAAPSLADSDDALRLAKAADGVVLVVRGGRLSREDLRRATRRLDEAGAPILGVATTRLVGLSRPEVATLPDPATTPAAAADGTAPTASRPGVPADASPWALSTAPEVVLDAPVEEPGSDLELTQPLQELPLVSSETVPADHDASPAHEWPVQAHEPTPEPFWVSTPAGPTDDLPVAPGETFVVQEPLTRAVPAVEMLDPWPGLESDVDTPVAASEASDEPEAAEVAAPGVEAVPQFVFPEPTPEDELEDASGDLPADVTVEPTAEPLRDGGPLFESVLVEPHRADLPPEPEAELQTEPTAGADETSAPEPTSVSDWFPSEAAAPDLDVSPLWSAEPLPGAAESPAADEAVAVTQGSAQPPVSSDRFPSQPQASTVDPLGAGFVVTAEDDPETTPTFDETASGLDDTSEVTPALVDDASEDHPTVAGADADDVLVEHDDGEVDIEDLWEDDDEPRTGSLLDSFLTEDEDDEEAEADLAPEPEDLGTTDDESDDDRVTMWRPSRWIG